MILPTLFLAAGGPLSGWFAKLHETFIVNQRYKMMIEGFRNTIVITLGALVIGVTIGMLIAVVKYLAEDVPGLKPLAVLCDLYVKVIRGIPMVVLLLIFFYIIFSHAKNGIPVAIIAFGVNSGAYMAELIRSGINAVDAGQIRAGNLIRNNSYDAVNPLMMVALIYLVLVLLLTSLLGKLERRLSTGDKR